MKQCPYRLFTNMSCVLFAVISLFLLFLPLQYSTHVEQTSVGRDIMRSTPDGLPTEKHKLNVLLIIADDMRPQITAYQDHEHPTLSSVKMHTPNLDYLASQSLLLKSAYTQQAVCSPSRTSFLTGRRPDTTRVYNLKSYFRETGGNFTSLPQFFKNNGYHSVGLGKVFHHGKASNGDEPASWTEPFYKPSNKQRYMIPGKPFSWRAVPVKERHRYPLPDEQTMITALQQLHRFAEKGKTGEEPFFMAVGFYKPHLPFVFPEEYLDLYPPDEVPAPTPTSPPIDMPHVAWSDYGELRGYKDIRKFASSGEINDSRIDANTTFHLRRAYFASVSYVDSLIGRLVHQVQQLGLDNNTIIAMLGDHGFVLGEHGRWCKHTNFELDTHAPMMIKVPGKRGVVSNRMTELVDLYPTLVEAAGFEPVNRCSQKSRTETLCSEGSSMMPLFDNPELGDWKTHVFSQHPRDGRLMGYSVRSKRFRYTEWVRFNKGSRSPDSANQAGPVWHELYARELYDYGDADVLIGQEAAGIVDIEYQNMVYQPAYENVCREMREALHAGWRGQLKTKQRGNATQKPIESAQISDLLLQNIFHKEDGKRNIFTEVSSSKRKKKHRKSKQFNSKSRNR